MKTKRRHSFVHYKHKTVGTWWFVWVYKMVRKCSLANVGRGFWRTLYCAGHLFFLLSLYLLGTTILFQLGPCFISTKLCFYHKGESRAKWRTPQATGVQHHHQSSSELPSQWKPKQRFKNEEVFQFVAKFKPAQWEVAGSRAIFNKDEPLVLPSARRVVTAGGLPFSYAPALK